MRGCFDLGAWPVNLPLSRLTYGTGSTLKHPTDDHIFSRGVTRLTVLLAIVVPFVPAAAFAQLNGPNIKGDAI